MKKDEFDIKLAAGMKQVIDIPETVNEKIQNAYGKLEAESSFKKPRKILRGIGIGLVATFLISSISLAGYVAIGGDLSNIPFLNRLGIKQEEYQEYVSEIVGQKIEQNGVTIELKNMAADDTYLLLEYNMELADSAKYQLGEFHITKESPSGLYMTISNTLINHIEYMGGEQIEIEKISDSEYKIYQIISLIGTDVKDNFYANVMFRGLDSDYMRVGEGFGEDEYFEDNKIELSMNFGIEVSLDKAKANTKSIIPQNNIICRGNQEIIIEKVTKTPFNTILLMKIKSTKLYDDALIDFMIADEENNKVENSFSATDELAGGIVKEIKLKNGEKMILNGRIINSQEMPNEKEIEEVTSYKLITLKNCPDNFKIIAYMMEEGDHDVIYTDTEYYPVEDGVYADTNIFGGKITVTNIEITEKEVLFYYTETGLITPYDAIAVMRSLNNGIIDMYPDIDGEDENGKFTGYDRKSPLKAGTLAMSVEEIYPWLDAWVGKPLSDFEFTVVKSPKMRILGEMPLKIDWDTVPRTKIEKTNNSDVPEELNFYSKQVQKIYPFTGAFPDARYLYYYDSLNTKNMSNDFILNMAFSKITKEDWAESYMGEGELLSIQTELFEKYVKDIFGDINYTKKEFNNKNLRIDQEDLEFTEADVKFYNDKTKIQLTSSDVSIYHVDMAEKRAFKYDDRIEIVLKPVILKEEEAQTYYDFELRVRCNARIIYSIYKI